MFGEFNKFEILETIIGWFGSYIWTEDMLYQIIIILSAFVIAKIFYRMVRPRINKTIDDSGMPIRVKRIFNNLHRLIQPLTTLTVIFFVTRITSSEFMGMKISFSDSIMKVLLAWIVIRVALQFIANSLVRNFFTVSILITAALSIFGILDQTTTTLDAVGFNIGHFRLSTLAIIKSIFSLFVLLYLAMFASTFLERRVLRSKSLTRSSQVLVVKIIRITLIVFAVLMGITSAGIDLSIFALFSGAVGLGIGFGLQKVVSNLFSGLLLLMDKSINPGDVIELENSGTFGWVNHMAARYTEIVTRDNKSFLIPNEDFITQRVVNWSHGNKLIRLEVDFGVHYDSDPHEVIRIATEAATRPERVVSTPEPLCSLMEFGESSLNFYLRFWIKDAEEGVRNIQGEVMLALWDVLKENNIDIPYPHREVYLHDET